MNVELAIIMLTLAGLGALVGLVVRGVLRDRAIAAEGHGDEAIDRALRHGTVGGFVSARRQRELREGLPDTLDMLANSLSAGLTLPQSILRNLDHLPPAVAAEFARVLYDMRLGYSIGGAFDNLSRRLRMSDYQMVAIASKIGIEHGGKLHENYHSLSNILRGNLAFQRELHAMTTEGRMQAIVMSCLPLVMLCILGLIQTEMIKPMFTTLAGWMTLVVLFSMQAIAFLWIRKIVQVEV